jgi:hypothetical protein
VIFSKVVASVIYLLPLRCGSRQAGINHMIISPNRHSLQSTMD